jgi:hypothetical protein
VVVHTYNPSYLGDRDRRISSLRPYCKNKLEKIKRTDWRCGSSGRVPALQVQSHEFKHQPHQKKKVKRAECVTQVVEHLATFALKKKSFC